MSDYTVYDSELELRENLNDVNELLADFDSRQQALDEQRGVLADQVQGALAIYEKQVSDYEQKRDDLDRRQNELREQRQPFDEARERLQTQVDAKRDTKLGKAASDGTVPEVSNQTPDTKPDQANKPVTREQIDALKKELSKPDRELTLDPPGMGESQASAIDKDLKRMADIRQKEQKMDDASQNLREGWSRSNKPKR